MTLKTLMIIATYCINLLLFISKPARTKKALSLCGNKVMDVKATGSARSLMIYAFAVVLPGLLFIRDFGTFTEVVDCAISVVAFEMATRELALKDINGVYEKAVICGTNFVEYSDILAFPVLELPLEEQENYDPQTLAVVCNKSGTVNIAFASEDECKKATDLIRSLSGK